MVTDCDFLASDFDSIQSEDIKQILEHKVGVCVWCLAFKIGSKFKSCVVYSSLYLLMKVNKSVY